ncbi:MAG: hypothetical protein WBQ89_00040, partial [Candidatus Acidiferrum sp.]
VVELVSAATPRPPTDNKNARTFVVLLELPKEFGAACASDIIGPEEQFQDSCPHPAAVIIPR